MNRRARWTVAVVAAIALPLGSAGPAAASASASAPVTVQHELVETPARAAVEQAVAPTECDTTALDVYVADLIAAMTDEQLTFLFSHIDTLLNVPTYDALLVGTTQSAEHALSVHAQQLRKTFRELQRFWSDIDSDDIQLIAMHGDVLLDAERIAATLTAMIELGVIGAMTPAEVTQEAQTVADFMRTQGDFFDNPLWTFNAFAFSGEDETDPSLTALPDKIVMGDGIIEAYDTLGLGDVAPRVILAHEFAHHVQFELHIFDSGPADPAEATRRTELMADAMAAYFGVHKKGLALNKKRVVDALTTFATVGDCQFDSAGHHGTPLQRERAAAWGADLAAAARPASMVLSTPTVIARFDAALSAIVDGT